MEACRRLRPLATLLPQRLACFQRLRGVMRRLWSHRVSRLRARLLSGGRPSLPPRCLSLRPLARGHLTGTLTRLTMTPIYWWMLQSPAFHRLSLSIGLVAVY